ncbi:MAG: PD-(D/E)XK motif protein [Elusimicrobia bacterium]|nr:PD-(D/E)XK motif protein [Elusimicrobiota bacterium]
MKRSGVLTSLLESLDRGIAPGQGRLSGQKITLKRNGCSAWISVDSIGFAHLLLSPPPAEFSKFTKLKMKRLSFGIQNWIVSQEKGNCYIDVLCRANRTSPMRRPFIGFCEDVIHELDEKGLAPEDALYKTAIRWQRFWSVESEPVSDAWIQGLVGELIFLRGLLNAFGKESLRVWTGPDGLAHDFQGNRVGIEVKATTTQPPVLQISNLNQLDSTLFSTLHVLVYGFTVASKGLCLPDLVREIEGFLGGDTEVCDLFWKKLRATGYHRHLEDRYSETLFRVDQAVAFPVDNSFPKITNLSFSMSLDSRVRNVRYSIELAGIRGVALDSPHFLGVLKTLCEGGSDKT